MTDELFNYVLGIASGKEKTNNEKDGYRDLEIFKGGVTPWYADINKVRLADFISLFLYNNSHWQNRFINTWNLVNIYLNG